MTAFSVCVASAIFSIDATRAAGTPWPETSAMKMPRQPSIELEEIVEIAGDVRGGRVDRRRRRGRAARDFSRQCGQLNLARRGQLAVDGGEALLRRALRGASS